MEARSQLNFQPAVLETEEKTKDWERDVGWDKAIGVSMEAMSNMGLPWYFGFYWMACFCADYRRKESVDYSEIRVPPQKASEAWSQGVKEQFVRDRGIVMLYHKGGAKRKLYPPYPFLIETSFLFGLDRGERPSESQKYGTMTVKKEERPHEVSGVFAADKDGFVKPGINGSITRNVFQIKVPAGTYAQIFFGEKRGTPPKFTVELPMFLATEDVVSMAFKHIQVYREGFRHYVSHPLLGYAEQVKTEPDKYVVEQMREPKEDIEQYRKGKLAFEELIQREWQRELAREDTVARRLEHRQGGLSRVRTVVYHRVRRRLVRAGITPPDD